jgi:hypothetical protein
MKNNIPTSYTITKTPHVQEYVARFRNSDGARLPDADYYGADDKKEVRRTAEMMIRDARETSKPITGTEPRTDTENYFSQFCITCGYRFHYITAQSINFRVLCDSCAIKRSKREYASDAFPTRGRKRKTGDLHNATRRAIRAAHSTIKALRTHTELKETYATTQAARIAAYNLLDANLKALYAYKGANAETLAILKGNNALLSCTWQALTAQEKIFFHALQAANAARNVHMIFCFNCQGVFDSEHDCGPHLWKSLPLAWNAVKYSVKLFDDACGVAFYVFPASVSDEEALNATEFTEYYNGAGASFADFPVVRRTKTRVLVSQRFGLDI